MDNDNKVRIRLMEPCIPDFQDYKFGVDFTASNNCCVDAMQFIFKHAKITSFKFVMYSPNSDDSEVMKSAIVSVVAGKVIDAKENFDMCVGDLIDE